MPSFSQQDLLKYAQNRQRPDALATLLSSAQAPAAVVPTVTKVKKVSPGSSGGVLAAPATGSAKGLSPTVRRALAFARANGWKGQVNSGFRTYAEQVVLYNRYLHGGNLAAKPGTSRHESGDALDVSDYQGFKRAMDKAPKGARLKWFGPGDSVHFSIDGH